MDKSMARREIRIPGFDGYVTLKCDFHIHTVFSDGLVWPTVRVDEAWNEGLDAIAITDHIEYRPFQDIVRGDLNESFKIAVRAGKERGVIVIQGTEITRNKPFGHMNALFIDDANKLQVETPEEAIAAALTQGAFIMWNHPGWPDDASTMYEIHEQLIAEGKIHGVETFNFTELYPVSLDWCRSRGLTFMGNSDIHNTIVQTYGRADMARPMTLVFAAGKNEGAIRDALFDGRTAVWFNGYLAGRADLLEKLVKASLAVTHIDRQHRTAEVSNCSDIAYTLKYGDTAAIVPAGGSVRLILPTDGLLTVANCMTGEDSLLEITLD